MSWLARVVVSVLAVFALGYLRAERRRKRALAGRVAGISEFARSLDRPEGDPAVRAVYDAMLDECRSEAAVVHGDDDLSSLWGVEDEDLDELVLNAVARLPESMRFDLRGTFVSVRTPRQVIELIESRSGRK